MIGILAGSEPDNVTVPATSGHTEPHKCWACGLWLPDGQPPSWHLDPETGDYNCPPVTP